MRRSTTRGPRGDIAAVFPDRATAREAAEELCAHGADPHLREALDGVEQRVYELDLGQVVRRNATTGALIGLPVGAVLGAVLVLLAGWGAGFSVPEALLAGGLPGVIAGLVFGAFAGLVRALWVFDDIDRWMMTGLGEGQVLMVARDHGQRAAVRRALRSHGGRLVETAAPSPSGGAAWPKRLRASVRGRRAAA